jgi:hypothetical protein
MKCRRTLITFTACLLAGTPSLLVAKDGAPAVRASEGAKDGYPETTFTPFIKFSAEKWDQWVVDRVETVRAKDEKDDYSSSVSLGTWSRQQVGSLAAIWQVAAIRHFFVEFVSTNDDWRRIFVSLSEPGQEIGISTVSDSVSNCLVRIASANETLAKSYPKKAAPFTIVDWVAINSFAKKNGWLESCFAKALVEFGSNTLHFRRKDP